MTKKTFSILPKPPRSDPRDNSQNKEVTQDESPIYAATVFASDFRQKLKENLALASGDNIIRIVSKGRGESKVVMTQKHFEAIYSKAASPMGKAIAKKETSPSAAKEQIRKTKKAVPRGLPKKAVPRLDHFHPSTEVTAQASPEARSNRPVRSYNDKPEQTLEVTYEPVDD